MAKVTTTDRDTSPPGDDQVVGADEAAARASEAPTPPDAAKLKEMDREALRAEAERQGKDVPDAAGARELRKALEPAPPRSAFASLPDKAAIGVMVKEGDSMVLRPIDSAEARAALPGREGAAPWASEVRATKAGLDRQEQVPVYLPQRGPGAAPLSAVEVQINDLTIRVERGRQQMVPAEVARILKAGGYMDLPA